MNLIIQDGILMIPEKKQLGRTIRPSKKIESVDYLRKNGKDELFDSYGHKTFMIMNRSQIDEQRDELMNIYLYDVQTIEHLEDNERLIIINNLKSTSSENVIARAKEFHQICIDRLTEFLA